MAKRGRGRPRSSLQGSWAEHQRKVDGAIARFQSSYMSNAKWRKALRILANPELGAREYRWKFVADEGIYTTAVVGENELDQAHLGDGRFLPYVYREIEWREVQTAQASEVIAVLARAGRFSVQPCEIGVRLMGYG